MTQHLGGDSKCEDPAVPVGHTMTSWALPLPVTRVAGTAGPGRRRPGRGARQPWPLARTPSTRTAGHAAAYGWGAATSPHLSFRNFLAYMAPVSSDSDRQRGRLSRLSRNPLSRLGRLYGQAARQDGAWC